jgi:chromatin segregation and condensation protein Rec8/ScpA/Scc1 (kleisin family)
LETFRAAAGDLAGRPTLGSEVFAAPAKGNKIDPALIPLADHQSELLVQAFQQVLSRLGEKGRVFSITIDSVSVVERMRLVVDTLRSCGGAATFAGLLAGRRDRAAAIGVFIALLELCKRRMIAVDQQGPNSEIQIRLADVEVDTSSVPQSDEELDVVAA